MRTLRRGMQIGACAAVVLGAGCATVRHDPAEPYAIRIGALVCLSGDRAKSGVAAKEAIQLAVDDIRPTLRHRRQPVEIDIVFADTGSDPEQAYEQLRALRREGIRSVVGPDSSDEALRILPWANRFGMILISPASTAPSLAIPNDNLFRLAPDDSHQARVMAEKMHRDGIQVIVPLWRDDPYAMDLLSSLRRAFLAKGGVLMRGVRYDPADPDPESAVEALRQAVENTVDAYGAAHVAVYMIAFDEAVGLARAAAPSHVLSSIPWYVNDGVTLNPLVTADAEAGAWAATVRLTGLQTRRARHDPAQTLIARLESKLGYPPENYALTAYDAVGLLVRAHIQAGKDADADALRRAIPRIAAATHGMSGNLALNDAGDRAQAAFDVFRVQETPEGSAWVRLREVR